MTSKLGKLFVAIGVLLALSTASFATLPIPVGINAFGESPTPLIVSRTSPEYTTIELTGPEVQVDQYLLDFETYQSFGMSGEPFVYEEGAPTIPHVSRYYRIPNTGGVDLVIGNTEFEIMDDVNALPFQIEGNTFAVARDEAIFSQDAWYPPQVATVSEPMILRDFRVVIVTLYPVQINPVTQQARIYNQLSVELVANDEPSENELLNPKRPSQYWVPIYESVIANLDENALINATDRPGSYMIITKNDAQNLQWTDSLRVWKTRRGFDVVVDARGNWNANTMRTAIQTAYANWDPPLEFVALMGDPSSFGVPTDGGNYDHTFALGNNGDDLEDIGVGRLSGESSSQMAIINAKIMAYERTPNMTDTLWYTKSFLYAGVANEIASNYTLMQWTAQQFRLNTGVQSNQVNWVNGHVSDQLVRDQLGAGVGYFFWRGSWLGQMDASLANTCNSGTRLPVVMCVTCGANEFVSGLGTAESYLVAGTSPTVLKGGICGIGTSTAGTHAPPNGTFAGGLLYAITTQLIEHIGHALNAGKVWLPLSFGSGSGEAQNFTRWNNLMGEPGLSMWTRVPTVLSVTHVPQLSVGARHMTLDVLEQGTNLPIDDALVVLWKGTEVYARELTDPSGHVEIPIDVRTPGDLLVTITKRNHVPYLATVPCAVVEQYVSITSFAVDDDNSGGSNGNSNGIVNPTETIDLPIYLRNFGTSSTATGISATLTSHNPHVSVVTGTATFTNLAPNDSALGSTAFRITVNPAMQHLETALLTLAITSNSGTSISGIDLECVGATADYISSQFTTPFAPGVTSDFRVTVRNNGEVTLAGATAQLTSFSPFVQVEDVSGTFGDIGPDQQVTNSADQFRLRANSLTFRGHVAPMMLIVTGSNGLVDTSQFTISVGTAQNTDPTGPDAFGYYAYDDVDASYEMHPTFQYLDISAGLGTNLNIADIGEKTTVSQVWSVARSLPFDFMYYGQTFDSITICSNGWAAFGSQAWMDGFRNFPIPAQQAPNAMMAPYWDDLKTSGANLGVWTYFDSTNHRYVIQWKAQGGSSFSTNLNFELILLDEDHHPTFDGNGRIVFQYQTVQLNLPGVADEADGQSIGIQAPNGQVGLPINYQNQHTPGSATVSNNRAIVFTTDARMLFGDITGTVVDAENDQPMPGVDVTVDGQNYHAVTNAQGQYTILDVLIGSYTVRASRYLYNDATVNDVIVELDSLETVNFSMLHPEFTLSRDTIFVSLPTQPETTSVLIQNQGNGPLDYTLDITYAGDDNTDPWDLLQEDVIDVTGLTGDHIITGVEFAGDYWYVTGGGGEQNQIYKFGLTGNLAGSIPQPGSSDYGWFDMAWDGDYLWGSQDEDNGVGYVVGIDVQTGQPVDSILSPINPSRAIAYNPDLDRFWVADYYSDIYEIDRNGNTFHIYRNEANYAITGLAWRMTDPDGFRLYMFSQDGTGTFTRVTRIHPLTLEDEFVVQLEANQGDRAGGCTITGGWNSTLLVFGGILTNNTGDRLGIYEVDFNTTWINVGPSAGDVAGPGQQRLSINLDPDELRPFTYRVNINIHSQVLDSTRVLPVVLTVEEVSADDPRDPVAREYALEQNFPNPFNPSTSIRYELKEAGVTKLLVYNVTGQQVATLVDQVQPAGVYTFSFDGSSLASGIYFYRLESGGFVDVKKMVLLK